MKGELLEKVEKVKDIDEETYHKLVDELTQKYQKVKGMTVEELTELTKELKANWKKIKDEAKKTESVKSAKRIIKNMYISAPVYTLKDIVEHVKNKFSNLKWIFDLT